MIQITTNLKQITGKIAEWKRQIEYQSAQNSPILKRVGVQATRMIQENIRNQQDSKGTRWPALSYMTIQKRLSKGRKSGNLAMLRDTGALYNTIDYDILLGYVRVGTGKEYGKKHQFGMGKRLPKREWLYVSESGKKKIENIVKHQLTNIQIDFNRA